MEESSQEATACRFSNTRSLTHNSIGFQLSSMWWAKILNSSQFLKIRNKSVLRWLGSKMKSRPQLLQDKNLSRRRTRRRGWKMKLCQLWMTSITTNDQAQSRLVRSKEFTSTTMNQAENFQTSIKVARSKKSSSRISLTTINTEAWRASRTVGTTHLTLALKQHRRGSSCIQTRSPKTTTKSIRLKTTRTIPMQLQELCWARTLKCSRWLTRDRAWIRFWTKEPLVCLRHQTLRFLRIPSTLPRSWQLPTLLAR